MHLVMECMHCGYRASGVQTELCPVCKDVLIPETQSPELTPWTFWGIVKVVVLLPFLPAMLVGSLAIVLVLILLKPVFILIVRILPEPRQPDAQGGAKRCRHCRYNLARVKHNCPECGQPFDPDEPETYELVNEERLLSSVAKVIVAGLCMALLMLIMFLFEDDPIDIGLVLLTVAGITMFLAAVVAITTSVKNRRIRRLD